MAEEWKSVTITLLHPIKVGELSLSTITLREPDLEALEKIDDIGFEAGMRPSVRQLRLAIEALSGQETQILNRLHKDDFEALGEAAVPLLFEPTESDDDSASTEATPGTSPATSAPS